MRRSIVAALLVLVVQGQPAAAQGKPLFTFHNGFWVNLHHFLYVLGRARAGTPDSQRLAVVKAPTDIEGFDRLKQQERQSWDDAVAYYRDGPSKQDVVFDSGLIATARCLAVVDDSASLAAAGLPARSGQS